VGSKVKGQGHESQSSAGVGLICTLVSAGFFHNCNCCSPTIFFPLSDEIWCDALRQES